MTQLQVIAFRHQWFKLAVVDPFAKVTIILINAYSLTVGYKGITIGYNLAK